MSRAAAFLVAMAAPVAVVAFDAPWSAERVFEAPAAQVRAALFAALEESGFDVLRELSDDEIVAHDRTVVRQPAAEKEALAVLERIARYDAERMGRIRAGSEYDLSLRIDLRSLSEDSAHVRVGGRIVLLQPTGRRGVSDSLPLRSLGVMEEEILRRLDERLGEMPPPPVASPH